MRRLNYILILLLIGCSTSRHLPPSTFSIDGRKHNRLIVNYSTKQNRGEVAACLNKGNLDIGLNTSDPDTLIGLLLDSKTKEPIQFTTVQVYQEGKSSALEIVTKPDGTFKFSVKPRLERIVVESVGFRRLEVKLEGFKIQLTDLSR